MIGANCPDKVKTFLSGLKGGELFSQGSLANAIGENKDTVRKAMKSMEEELDPCIFWYRKLEKNEYPRGEDLKRIIEDSKSKEDKKDKNGGRYPDIYVRVANDN